MNKDDRQMLGTLIGATALYVQVAEEHDLPLAVSSPLRAAVTWGCRQFTPDGVSSDGVERALYAHLLDTRRRNADIDATTPPDVLVQRLAIEERIACATAAALLGNKPDADSDA